MRSRIARVRWHREAMLDQRANWRCSSKRANPSDLEMYEKLIFSETDTALMVKLKNKPVQVGYYLSDVHQFIPFEWDKKNKRFYGQKPTGEYELAYLKKRDRR